MHACMHACMHTCIHAYMHTCIHAYMHTCIHACMHACIHTYIHTCIHACIHTYIHNKYIYIYIYIRTWIQTYLRTYKRTYLQNRTDIHTYIHVYMFFAWHRLSYTPAYAGVGFFVPSIPSSLLGRNSATAALNAQLSFWDGWLHHDRWEDHRNQGFRCLWWLTYVYSIVLHGLPWPLSHQESGKPTPTLLYNCYGGGCWESLRF